MPEAEAGERPGPGRVGGVALEGWAGRRRQELLALLDRVQPQIAELDGAVRREAERRPEVRQLMEQKGVGPLAGLAFALTVGPVERFANSRRLVSYLGLNPREDSSGGPQRLGHITKQGNKLVRWLLIEAAQSAARQDDELRRRYGRMVFRRGRKVAKVAIARRLAVRLSWALRQASPAASHAR